MKHARELLSILALMAVSACTTVHGVTPLSPAVGSPAWPSVVTSLQPTLSWQPAKEADVAYDLIVYESIRTGDDWNGYKILPGKEIYYREALHETSHQIQDALKPATQYFWSVRLRRGDDVAPWARYDWTMFLVFSYSYAYDQYFSFKTPDNVVPGKEAAGGS